MGDFSFLCSERCGDPFASKPFIFHRRNHWLVATEDRSVSKVESGCLFAHYLVETLDQQRRIHGPFGTSDGIV